MFLTGLVSRLLFDIRVNGDTYSRLTDLTTHSRMALQTIILKEMCSEGPFRGLTKAVGSKTSHFTITTQRIQNSK